MSAVESIEGAVWALIETEHPEHATHAGWTYQFGEPIRCACGANLYRVTETP